MFADTSGRLLLVIALLAAASLWLTARRRRDGHFVDTTTTAATTTTTATTTTRTTHAGANASGALTAADLGQPLGGRATFVQFSTATCATCPQVRRILGDLARRTGGVQHVEVTADERLDLVRRFGIRRTPTVLLLGHDGAVVSRASGPMDAAQAAAALHTHLIPGATYA